MRGFAKLGMALLLAAALFVVGGVGAFRAQRQDGPAAPASAREAGALLLPAGAAGSLEDGIAALQARLKAIPGDWRAYASLGLAYVQEARITADPSYYPKAEGVLRESLSINGEDNFEAWVGMGALALARHDFAGALVWGERARDANPYNANVYGVIGDAQVELGRYRDAIDTFQTMVDTRPDLGSYARVSYARELLGDVGGAIRAMRTAQSFAGSPEDLAWTGYQLGELYFNSGRVAEAANEYRRGAEVAPDFVPNFAGLAKVAFARGDVDSAIARYADVVRRYPLPEYVIALGDLYERSGQRDEAGRQWDLLKAEEQLFRANGVNVDLEIALFEAVHGDPRAALRAARAEWDRRHSIHVADALGWALYANGRYADAARYAGFALKLGTRNALFFFHAGMIELKRGHADAARMLLDEAVRTNPSFSIRYAPVAKRELARLEGRP